MQREANNCQEVKSHNESDIMEKRAVASYSCLLIELIARTYMKYSSLLQSHLK